MHLPFHPERAAFAESGFGELLLKCASESFAEMIVGKSGSRRYLSEAGERHRLSQIEWNRAKSVSVIVQGRFFS
jgi:hypothetical protein